MAHDYVALAHDDEHATKVLEAFHQAQLVTRHRSISKLRYLCALLSALLFGSLMANLFFIHRQFIKPWKLLEELPSNYGK